MCEPGKGVCVRKEGEVCLHVRKEEEVCVKKEGEVCVSERCVS